MCGRGRGKSRSRFALARYRAAVLDWRTFCEENELKQAHFRLLWLLAATGCAAGCAVEDSRIAQRGRTALLGMKEVDLEACLGSPDQHSSFGSTDVLTYYANSTSSNGFSPPVIGGFSINNGAYCHATFRLDDGVVTHVIYSGEKNATLAPDAYCAPIIRSCLAELDSRRAKPVPAPRAPAGG